MIRTLSTNCVFVFDLDDTLFSEREFEYSGIKAVLHHLELNYSLSHLPTVEDLIREKGKWIEILLEGHNVERFISKNEILNIYRFHPPKISLYSDAEKFLTNLKASNSKTALITDGRSKTQRNKLEALGIHDYFDLICISEEVGYEKPSPVSFLRVEECFKEKCHVFFGDNIKKDFVIPRSLGWSSFGMLNRGNNVHPQFIDSIDHSFLPDCWLNSFEEITLLTREG
jgi:putative hydrolase of the HAD superfamily